MRMIMWVFFAVSLFVVCTIFASVQCDNSQTSKYCSRYLYWAQIPGVGPTESADNTDEKQVPQQEGCIVESREDIFENPLSFLYYIRSGDCRLLMKDFSGATSEYKTGLVVQPTSYHAHIKIAKTYQKQRKYNESISCIDHALSVYPAEEELYYLLGVSQYQQGNYQQSEESFRKALSINSSYYPAGAYLIWALQRQRHISESLFFIQKLTFQTNVDSRVQVDKGWFMLLECRNIEAALKNFNASHTTYSIDDNAYAGLGLSYLLNGDSTRARTIFLAGLQKYNNQSLCLAGLGHYYLAMNDMTRAYILLNRSLAIQPNNYIADVGLSIYFARVNDTTRSQAIFDAWNISYPESPFSNLVLFPRQSFDEFVVSLNPNPDCG